MPAYMDPKLPAGSPLAAQTIAERAHLPQGSSLRATGQTVVVNSIMFYAYIGDFRNQIKSGEYWWVGTVCFGFWLISALHPSTVRPSHIEAIQALEKRLAATTDSVAKVRGRERRRSRSARRQDRKTANNQEELPHQKRAVTTSPSIRARARDGGASERLPEPAPVDQRKKEKKEYREKRKAQSHQPAGSKDARTAICRIWNEKRGCLDKYCRTGRLHICSICRGQHRSADHRDQDDIVEQKAENREDETSSSSSSEL